MNRHLKRLLLASACFLTMHSISYGQYVNMTIYGSSGANPGNTVRYTTMESIAPYYLWTVSGGVFENGQTSMLKQGIWKYEAYVTWNCTITSNHYVNVVAFNTWPPNVPSGIGNLNVNVSCYVPPVHDCAYFQTSIDQAYQYAPPAYKCSTVKSIVNQAKSEGLNCSFDMHGCN